MAITVPVLSAKFDVFCGGMSFQTGKLNLAEAEDGKRYSVKLPVWRNYNIPLRLANELLFYSLATYNQLPVPESAVLRIEECDYWASAYTSFRPLTPSHTVKLSDDQRALLDHTFKQDQSERLTFLRARMLDMALLNSDRAPWNILGEVVDGIWKMKYFDHDRAFGWHGNPDAKHIVRTMEHVVPDSYFQCTQINDLVIPHSRVEECLDIFASLKLERELLDEAYTHMPRAWLNDSDYKVLRKFCENWWGHLPNILPDFLKKQGLK